MTNPAFTQVSFRIRNDNGSETTATWRQNQNVNDSVNVDEGFRVRFRIDETASRAWTNVTWNLYYNLNGAGYQAASTTTPVQYHLSTYFAQGDNTTAQLTGGTGTFVTTNAGMGESGGVTNSGTAGYLFEVEYCIELDSAQIADGDTVDLRVYNGTNPIAVYTVTPTITATERAIDNTDDITLGEIAPQVILPDALKVFQVDDTTLGESCTVECQSATLPDFGTNKTDGLTLGEILSVSPLSLQTNVSDNSTIVDSTIRSISDALISKSDGVAIGDSASGASHLAQQVADGIAVADTLEIARESALLPVQVIAADEIYTEDEPSYYSDDVAVGEHFAVSLPPLADLAVEVVDNTTLSEVRTQAMSDLRPAFVDSTTLADAVALRMDDLALSRNEATTIGDTLSIRESALVCSVADGVTLSDHPATTRSDSRIAASDSLTIADILQLYVPEIGTIVIQKTDSISVGDASSLAPSTRIVAVSDNQVVVDYSTVSYPPFLVSVSEVVQTTDSITAREDALALTGSDNLHPDDLLEIASALAPIAIADGITATDEVAVHFDLEISWLESATVGDAVVLETGAPSTLYLGVEDNCVLGDVPQASYDFIAIGITDTVVFRDFVYLGDRATPQIRIFDVVYDNRTLEVPFSDRQYDVTVDLRELNVAQDNRIYQVGYANRTTHITKEDRKNGINK